MSQFCCQRDAKTEARIGVGIFVDFTLLCLLPARPLFSSSPAFSFPAPFPSFLPAKQDAEEQGGGGTKQ